MVEDKSPSKEERKTKAAGSKARIRWIIIGLLIIGGCVGGVVVATNAINAPKPSPPDNSYVTVEDNSYWQDKTNSIFACTGVITNTHSTWSIRNIEIQVQPIGENNVSFSIYYVSPVPDFLAPGDTVYFSQILTLPNSCIYATTHFHWDWVEP